MKEHIEDVLHNRVKVSEDFVNIYRLMFDRSISPYSLVFESYLDSGYIMHDM